jgi:HD-GYP domain-containing protein (c-di-GMP phosphodiesterase class II)
LRLAEIMAALSLATDLGNGQPLEFSIRACILSLGLGERLGLNESELRDVYYYSLLRHVGCNAESFALAALVGDEIGVRRDFATIDAGQVVEQFSLLFRYLRQANADDPPATFIRDVIRGFVEGPEVIGNAIASYCEVAQSLARRLGFNATVIRALGQIYERWDGKGHPSGLKGEEIDRAVRIVILAQDAVIFQRLGGNAKAVQVARERSGKKYDPAVVERFCQNVDQLLLAEDDQFAWDRLLELEPGAPVRLTGAEVDTACQVFADFADLKSPYTLGHSPRVAALVADAGRHFGLPEADVVLLRRAGWVHEVGRVGVSAGIWTKTGPLSERDREQVRLHPYYTERILARPAPLAQIGALASRHHERLDGSGYHRGLTAAWISPPARLLTAANLYQALTESRPHRSPRSADDAASYLQRETREGRLDRDAVTSVLEAAGHRVRPVSRERVAGLSDREVEVLRLLARGHSTKQIAADLTISAKTADTHIQHVYTKIGVSTRAGATLFAVEHDLLAAS